VRPRGQPYDEQRSRRVTETRDRAAPVHLGGKFSLPLGCDIAAVTAQPWAELTADYLLIQLVY
jgi:hypothetical protein